MILLVPLISIKSVYDRYAIGAPGALSGQRVSAIAGEASGGAWFQRKDRLIALSCLRFQTGRARRKLRRTNLPMKHCCLPT